MSKKISPFKIASILTLLSSGYFATDIYIPSLPHIAEYFNVEDNTTQLTMFSYLMTFSLTPIFFGPLSDHIGRKKVILFGIFLALLATLGCYYSPTIDFMIAARTLQGIGAGAILTPSRSMLSDLFTGKDLAKQLSYITMFMPLILSIAPAIGGFLQEGFGWQSVFLFLSLYFLLLFLWIACTDETNETLSTTPFSKIFHNYQDVLSNRTFLLFALIRSLPTFAIFSYLTTSPFLFQEVIGLTPFEYGRLSFYIGGAIVLTSFLNSKLIHILSLQKLLAFGITLMIFSGLLLYLLPLTKWGLLLPSLLYFCTIPLVISNATSEALTRINSHFGSANGILATLQFLLGALGSFIFSLLPDQSSTPLALTFLSLGLLSYLLLFLAYQTPSTAK